MKIHNAALATLLISGQLYAGAPDPVLSSVVFKINHDITLSAKSFNQNGYLEKVIIQNNANDMRLNAEKMKLSRINNIFLYNSIIDISLQAPAECNVSEFSCNGRLIGITNHWPVLSEVNFTFSSTYNNQKHHISVPWFVFSPVFLTNMLDHSIHNFSSSMPLGVSAGFDFSLAYERYAHDRNGVATEAAPQSGTSSVSVCGMAKGTAMVESKVPLKDEGGCLFLFRNTSGVLCNENILGKEKASESIEKVFDFMGAALSNSLPQVSYEKIPIRSGDLAYFASDSQLARWRDASTVEFKKGESLFTNICDNIFYSALSRQPPLFECREGALGIFKEIEVEKGREFIYFNLVFEGALIGDDVQTNRFSVEILPEDGEVECIRTSVFTHHGNKSYMLIVGCRRRLESVCFPLGRLYFPPFNHDLSYFDGRAIIYYDGKEVGARNFSLCTPHFLNVDLDIRNERRCLE